MSETTETETATATLARRPIFDRRQRLWGYSIRYLTAEGAAVEPPTDQAFSVAASAYLGLDEVSRRGRKLVFDFTEKSVLDQLPYALPPNMAALRVSETLGTQDGVPDLLRRLKSDGHLIVVAGYSDRREARELYSLADILSLSVETAVDRGLEDRAMRARTLERTLLVLGVEDRRILAACQKIGFDLLEGGFYKSPEGIAIRKVGSGEMSRLRLFRLLEEDDPDFRKLGEAIQADAGLSYRLLAFLNSAAFGLRRSIKSIHQAVALLGWIRMRNWLRVALLSDLGSGRHRDELVYLAAQRGRFLEMLGRRFDYWGFDPNTLQLLGLFSLLEAILDLPFDEILLHLPIEERLKSALRGEPGNEYTPLLRLAELIEEGKWEEAGGLMQRLGLAEEGVRESFRSAVTWANQFAYLPSSTVE